MSISLISARISLSGHKIASITFTRINFVNEINTSKGNRCYLMYLNRQNENTTFNLEEVNSRTVLFHLSNLSKSKATDLDGMSSRLLQECPDLISEP